jgi:hypothetical protein
MQLERAYASSESVQNEMSVDQGSDLEADLGADVIKALKTEATEQSDPSSSGGCTDHHV